MSHVGDRLCLSRCQSVGGGAVWIAAAGGIDVGGRTSHSDATGGRGGESSPSEGSLPARG